MERIHHIVSMVIFAAVLTGCSGSDTATVSSAATATSSATGSYLSLAKSVTITTDAEGGSARPETVATDNRVFVLYLGHITTAGSRSFDVKVYDADMTSVLAARTIVSKTDQYGSPTDIRIARDGQYVFAFYETSTTTTTYLHGAKYALNDSFDLVAQAAEPIASAKPESQAVDGDEVLNDPAPLVGPSSVFVLTRLRYPLGTSGSTIYRVREFSKDDLMKISEFDLDLSSVADGRGRVASLLYWNDTISMALATTVSDQGLIESNDDGALCDILLVKMGQNWTFDPLTDVRTLSAEPNDRENYITGLRTDGNYLYMTYKQSVASTQNKEHRAIIKIFDVNYSLLHTEVVRSVVWGAGGGEIRPSLEVYGTTIFSGQSTGASLGTGNAEIYVYEIQ